MAVRRFEFAKFRCWCRSDCVSISNEWSLFSLRFNSHLFRWTWSSWIYWSQGWWRWWWQLEIYNVQSSSQIITTNKPTPNIFLQVGCPSYRQTMSKRWREEQSRLLIAKLVWNHTCIQLCFLFMHDIWSGILCNQWDLEISVNFMLVSFQYFSCSYFTVSYVNLKKDTIIHQMICWWRLCAVVRVFLQL